MPKLINTIIHIIKQSNWNQINFSVKINNKDPKLKVENFMWEYENTRIFFQKVTPKIGRISCENIKKQYFPKRLNPKLVKRSFCDLKSSKYCTMDIYGRRP